MWSNFHTHSNYCDGKGTFQQYLAKQAVSSIGFSSHAPVPFQCKWCMKSDDLPQYLSEINTLKKTAGSTEVYAGLEIDYIPGKISPLDFAPQLDYTIGSIHFVEAFPDGTPWEIDGQHTLFMEGLNQIFQSDIKAAITCYFELTRLMVQNAQPTIVGHLDKIKIQNIDNKFYHETDQWYQHEVLKTLKAIKSTNAIIEVNTRGLYQKKSNTTYPSPWILQHILELNIPITLSSDAHHPDDIINQFPESAAQLQAIGFKTVSVLKEGKWQQLNFNETGITF